VRRPRGGQIAIEGRGGHPDALGDLGNRNIGVRKQRHRGFNVLVREFRRSASHTSRPPCGGKPCLGAFADQASLELGEGAEHVKNEPSLRRRRIERFRQAPKADFSQPERFERLNQLLHGTREAVELPNDDRVARSREFERVAQGGSIRHRSRRLLDKKLRASGFRQRVLLQRQILVEGRNPRVADQNALRMYLAVRTRRRRLTWLLRRGASDARDRCWATRFLLCHAFLSKLARITTFREIGIKSEF